MGVRWRRLVETEDDFLQAAPFRYINTIDVPMPAERLWAALTADDAFVSWSPLVTGLRLDHTATLRGGYNSRGHHASNVDHSGAVLPMG